MTDKSSSKNADGIHEPFPVDAVPWETFAKGERFSVRYRQLGEFGGGSHVGVCIETLDPGKRAYPSHYHMLEEEHLLILDGELSLRLGDRTYTMKTGDYVCFPAGQKLGHAIANDTDSPCRYLIIGERNPNEVVVYPDSGRVSVRLTGDGYDGASTVDYWEGEDI